jgi:hypothetical protein
VAQLRVPLLLIYLRGLTLYLSHTKSNLGKTGKKLRCPLIIGDPILIARVAAQFEAEGYYI